MKPIEARTDARTRDIAATPAQVYAAICDPVRIARWWGPDGFSSTVHRFEFHPGGKWVLTLHGPDGKNYPNEYRLLRVLPERLVEIERPSEDHHFVLAIELARHGESTRVSWRQTFATVAQYQQVADFVAHANEQVLDRLSAEVRKPPSVA